MQQQATANQNHTQHWQRSWARPGTRARQKGIALILFVMVVIIGVTILFAGVRSPNALQLERNQITLDALRMAKEALIAYAATHPDRPGGLPCPDANNDGDPNISGTNCETELGWLPFRKLQLPDLRDSNGDRLWYAVSTGFQENINLPLNSDSVTNITLNGTPGYIALVIAPQRPVNGQGARAINDSNPSGDSSEVLNYLEQANAQTPFSNFISADEDTTDDIPFNDVVLGIKPVEMLPIVEQRVAGDLMNMLEKNRGPSCTSPSKLPFPADFGNDSTELDEDTENTTGTIPSTGWGSADGCPSLPRWYLPEAWYTQTYYERCETLSSDCLEYCRNAADCATDTGTKTDAIVMIAGRALAGQTDRSGRPKELDEFFEDSDMTDRLFVQNNPKADYNNHNDTLRALSD